MENPIPGLNSLVLYKNGPARVIKSGDKLEIKLAAGKTVKVRPKDVQILHPGPLARLTDLTPQTGDAVTAWELLAGQTTTLADLADLIYQTCSPVTAWAAWELVADGLYFFGTPDKITARSAAEVAAEQLARQTKTAEKEAWNSFLQRLHARQIKPEDAPHLRDAEALALEQQPNSRVLRELGRAETPENAHALLLELNWWPPTLNPYPQRLGVSTAPPDANLPPLPDEARLNLTHLPAFAIDDEDSHDPDDALSLDGNRLWIHIADVAALVAPDSPADYEARARAANLYLPEGTVPMLPASATQMLGLGLAEVSPALSVGLDLDSNGEMTNLEITPSWVNVQRLTYAQVETRLEEEPFRSLHRLAHSARARRLANNAIELDLPEVKIRVTAGQVEIRPLPPLQSRNLVREAMLLCGEALARFAAGQDIPFPFNIQDPPDSLVPLDSMAAMFAQRKAMKRSLLKSAPSPHAGLGLDYYTQATSPLRRYADMVAHQQLRAHLRGDPLLTPANILTRLGQAEAMSAGIRQAERMSNRHWTMVYLMQKPRWRGSGVLVDKQGARGVILIPELDLETRLHLRQDLPLNSKIELALNSVNLPELDAFFQLAG